MGFSRIIKVSTLVGTLFLLLASCTNELDTIGEGVVAGEPFTTGKVEYDVFAFNKGITAVQTNKLPLYQLGTFNDPVYGKRNASILTQLSLPNRAGNPTFGDLPQDTEDTADTDDLAATVKENETVKEVYLYLPFQLPPSADTDGDGIDDIFEEGDAVTNPNSDWDGDGVTDNQERVNGSNPFDASDDGTQDGFVANNYLKRYDLDSIYGDRTKPFRLIVSRSNYFLRDLDPNSGFEDAQEYYSNQDFSSFIGEEFFNGEVTISDEEIPTSYAEDDPETTDVDESTQIASRVNPGIRVPLNPEFFQTNILDKEGDAELLSQSNFNNFFRGVHLAGTDMEQLMFLFDLTAANITITYEYTDYDPETETTTTSEKDFVLSFLTTGNSGTVGNAVNAFQNEDLSPNIASSLDTDENASRIYVKGAETVAEIRLFDAMENGGADIINQIKNKNWVINEANLVFYVDRETLDLAGPDFVEAPRLYLYNAETSQPLFVSSNEPSTPNTTLNPLDFYPNHDGVLEKENGLGVKYTVRITEHINNIIVRDSTNATLGLTLTPNIAYTVTQQAMDNLVQGTEYPIAAAVSPLSTILYGSNLTAGEEAKKLKLEIYYTEAN